MRLKTPNALVFSAHDSMRRTQFPTDLIQVNRKSVPSKERDAKKFVLASVETIDCVVTIIYVKQKQPV